MDDRQNPQAAFDLVILDTLAAAAPQAGFGIARHGDEASGPPLRPAMLQS